MTEPVHSEMLRRASTKDVRTAAITALVLACLTIGIGSFILETMENVQTTNAPRWILGRSTGLAAYLLLLMLSVMGLLLAHPERGRWVRPSALTRIRIHVSLAVFTLAFLIAHIYVLATDAFAHVGWAGAFIPFAAEYRPAAVALGILALWSGLVSGLTAASAGSRLLVRAWWPLHKIAIVAFGLTWLHAVLAGSDTGQLRTFYALSGAFVIGFAIWRYASPGHVEKQHAVAHRARLTRPHLLGKR